jgi:hypothetical protein
MGLMMLGAAMGDSITIHVSGMEAADALEKLATLVEERFRGRLDAPRGHCILQRHGEAASVPFATRKPARQKVCSWPKA